MFGSVFQLVGSLLLFGHGCPGASSEHLKQPKVVVVAILKFKIHCLWLRPSFVGETWLSRTQKFSGQWMTGGQGSTTQRKLPGDPRPQGTSKLGVIRPIEYICSDTFLTLLATHKPFSTDWNAGITQINKSNMHKIAGKCAFLAPQVL